MVFEWLTHIRIENPFLWQKGAYSVRIVRQSNMDHPSADERISAYVSKWGLSLNGVAEDIAFADSVNSGHSNAVEVFVNTFTDLILSKVWSLMKTHCYYPAREKTCSMIILQKQRKGAYPDLTSEDQCDECMDSYIWFFDFLKNKIKSYKGTNNCSLKTFVWSVVNSPSTYKEWLRWRYGRAY